MQVDSDKTVVEAHDIAERVHETIEKNFPNVKHCMVHVNPAKAVKAPSTGNLPTEAVTTENLSMEAATTENLSMEAATTEAPSTEAASTENPSTAAPSTEAKP